MPCHVQFWEEISDCYKMGWISPCYSRHSYAVRLKEAMDDNALYFGVAIVYILKTIGDTNLGPVNVVQVRDQLLRDNS